jgi:hypothetical protein
MTEWARDDGWETYARIPPSGGPYGAGAEERVTRRGRYCTSILTIGYHTGCAGFYPCSCMPTKVSDAHFPRSADVSVLL